MVSQNQRAPKKIRVDWRIDSKYVHMPPQATDEIRKLGILQITSLIYDFVGRSFIAACFFFCQSLIRCLSSFGLVLASLKQPLEFGKRRSRTSGENQDGLPDLMREEAVGKHTVLHGGQEVLQPAKLMPIKLRIEFVEEYQRHFSFERVIA